METRNMKWAETLNTVARHLGVEPQTVTSLAEKSGINRTKVREALGVLEHDGVAVEMVVGWIHADKKNGRLSRKEEFARTVREHPLLGSAEQLIEATMRQFTANVSKPTITFSDEMITACEAHLKARFGIT
jgi:predicted transcriptional regulator